MIKNNVKEIVLLSGWLQSGKDTVGNFLVTKYGFKRYAYADALKNELSTMLNFDRGLMDTIQGKKQMVNGITIRQHLIKHGQAMRNIDPLYWVKTVCNQIIIEDHPRIVITDCRMLNEIEHIMEIFGKNKVVCCRINRWTEAPLQDETENTLDNFNFDLVINNDGNVENLYEQLIMSFDNKYN